MILHIIHPDSGRIRVLGESKARAANRGAPQHGLPYQDPHLSAAAGLLRYAVNRETQARRFAEADLRLAKWLVPK